MIYSSSQFSYSDSELSYIGDAAFTRVFTGDADLAIMLANQFSGKANLKKLGIGGQFTSDAMLTVTHGDVFTSEANLYKHVDTTIISTPWRTAGATGSSNDWDNPANALVDDSTYARATQTGFGSLWQSYHHWGFNVPVDAVITNVEVRIRHRESSNEVIDGGVKMRLVKPNLAYGEKEAPIHAIEITDTLGSGTDLWGLTVAPADVNSNDLMFDIGVYSYAGKVMSSYLYYIEARVSYVGLNAITSDANLFKTELAQFTGDAKMTKIISMTPITGDANLLRHFDTQLTVDSNLKRIVITSFTGDANLEKTELKYFHGEARLLGENEGQWRGEAYLYDNDLKFLYGPWTYGTLYGGIIGGDRYEAGSFTGDADLKKLVSNQFNSNANLRRRNITSTFTSDANIERIVATTFRGDAHLARIKYGTFTSDADLKAVLEGQFNSNAFITHPRFFGDASLSKVVESNYTGDAALFKEYRGTFTGDASLNKVVATSFTSDANLRKTNIMFAFTGDASLRGSEASQFTGDSILVITRTGVFYGDASLLSIATSNFDSSANLKKLDIQDYFTGDAVLLRIISNQFTGDTNLLRRDYTLPFTGDCFFEKESLTQFAGKIVLESAPQRTGFAGTVDCVNVSSMGWGLSGLDEYTLDLGI